MAARDPRLRCEFHGHGLAVYPPGSGFGPRRLNDFELVWIVDGEVECHCDDRRLRAGPGAVSIVQPGTIQGYAWDRERRTCHGFVHFNLVAGHALLPPPASWPDLRHGRDGVFDPLLRHLLWLLDRPVPQWRDLAESALAHILLVYVHGADGLAGEATERFSPPVERALAHVSKAWSADCHRPLSLPELARVAGVSRSHLVRRFQAELGATPMEALRLLRLDRAARLLSGTNLGVAEIAGLTGFASPYHFSRSFHAIYGKAPSAFRSLMQAGGVYPTIRLVRLRDVARGWMRRDPPTRPGPLR